MVRWAVAAGCALAMAACGTRTDGRGGSSGLEGSSPDAVDAGTVTGGGATDGGTLVCSGGNARATVNAGGGSACGITPELGTPRTARAQLRPSNPDGGLPQEVCEGVGRADGLGDVLIIGELFADQRGGTPTLYAFDVQGQPLGSALFPILGVANPLPLQSGWMVQALDSEPQNTVLTTVRRYTRSLGDGELVFSGDQPSAFALDSPVGGAVVVAAELPPLTGDPECTTDRPQRLVLSRFDASGTEAVRRTLECVPAATAVYVGQNAAGDVLVLERGTAWHLSVDGSLTSAPTSREGLLLPLIDGRFALNEGAWTRTIDLDGQLSGPPCWLQGQDILRFQIVLGGRAYLAFHEASAYPRNGQPCDQDAELILADGTSCGFIHLPDNGVVGCRPETVNVGLDGTLTALDSQACTARFWPGIFR